MSEEPGKAQKIVQHVLTVLLLVVVGANVWWFLVRDTHQKPNHPLAEAQAPAFDLPSIDKNGAEGQALSLASLQGKVVVLDFWATHCKPCKRQMPILDKIHRDMDKERFSVVSINIDDADSLRRHERISKWITKGDYSFPVILDSGTIWKDYKVKRIPTLFILDAKGTVADVHTGVISEKKLRQRIERVLDAQPGA